MNKSVIIFKFILVLVFIACVSYAQQAQETKGVSISTVAVNRPTKGMVTMIDLGATECIPCKMMTPVIDEIRKEYQGKASIIFIDVWKNREEYKTYNLQAIPTQIFFDKNGIEVFRHVGFMEKKSIESQLEKMGVK